MAAEKGRNFNIQTTDGTSPVTFSDVAGIKSNNFSINNELVDITSMDDAGKRKLLADAGVQSVKITGSGVFTDTTNEGLITTRALAQSIDSYQVVTEGGDTFAGSFQIASLEYVGEHAGARTYSVTLESSGAVTYTPAA
jgi:TP901-1 family phage major tail protein